MKTNLLFIFLLAPIYAWAEQVVVISNVNLITMKDERVIRGVDVLIEETKIKAIGPNLRLPENALVISGKGKYLIPGLAEMHAHIPIDSNKIDRFIWLNIANGITTVRGMLGAPQHLKLRNDINQGLEIGPQIFTAGPSANGYTTPTVKAAQKLVQNQKEKGYDLIKIHPGIKPSVFRALAEKTKQENMELSGHIPEEVGLIETLNLGIKTIEHIDGFWAAASENTVAHISGGVFGLNYSKSVNQQQYQSTIQALKSSGVWITPTYTLYHNILGGESVKEMSQRAELIYWDKQEVQKWKADTRHYRQSNPNTQTEADHQLRLQRQLILDLQHADVPLLLGADAPQLFAVPGFSTLQELEYMHQSGLTPFEALEAGTINPAKYLEREHEFGTLEIGRRADMILLAKNPLQSLDTLKTNLGVMLAGKWYSRETLDKKLNELKSR